jgi:uncharacterized OB-fold protein
VRAEQAAERRSVPSGVPAGEPDWLVVDDLAPDPTGSLAPMYEAARRGELLMPFCPRCQLCLELEQEECDRCDGSPPLWLAVAPVGVVHSITVVHRRQPDLVRTDGPYPVLDVELASGHRVIMSTARAGCLPRIGDRVDIGFRLVGGVALPAVLTAPDEHHSKAEA